MKAYYLSSRTGKQKSRRRPLLVGLVLLAAMAAAVIGIRRWLPEREWEKTAGTPASSSTVAVEPNIPDPHIGVIVPLTGAFRREGEMLLGGIRLAWEKMRDQGNRGGLVVQDSEQEGLDAVRWVTDLVHRQDLILLMAHLPATVLAEIMPICEKSGIPLLVLANTHESVASRRWTIPFLSCDHEEGKHAAILAAGWARDRGVVVIQDPGPYGTILEAGFRDGAESERIEVTTVGCWLEDPKMDTVLELAIRGNPPVIWLAGPPAWGAEIIRSIARKGFKNRLLVPQSYGRMIQDGLFDPNEEKLSIVWQVAMMDPRKPETAELRNTFLHTYLREPDWMALLGYDAMQWAARGCGTGKLTRTKMLEHFKGIGRSGEAFQGLAGTLSMDSQGCAQRPFQLAVFRGGKLTPASP